MTSSRHNTLVSQGKSALEMWRNGIETMLTFIKLACAFTKYDYGYFIYLNLKISALALFMIHY